MLFLPGGRVFFGRRFPGGLNKISLVGFGMSVRSLWVMLF